MLVLQLLIRWKGGTESHANLPLDAPQLAGGRKAGAPKARVELRLGR
jgi:hypothetical protein